MTGLTVITWVRFVVWLVLGLADLLLLQPASQRVREAEGVARLAFEGELPSAF